MLNCSVMSNSLWLMECSPPASSVHGISRARILEWVAMPSSMGSSWPRDQMHLLCFLDCRQSLSTEPLGHRFLKNNFVYIFFIVSGTGFSLLFRISLVVVSGAILCCGVQASHCGGFSCCGAWALGRSGFSSCSHAREHRLDSCDTWHSCSEACGSLPRSGIEPVSPALAGGFLSTEPSWKTRYRNFCLLFALIFLRGSVWY